MNDLDKLKYILQNQQKEMRAYDQKAGYYISSNTAVFVIAIFTLCVFNLFHNGGDYCGVQLVSFKWWVLLLLMIAYILIFAISSVYCLLVLYPRHPKSNGDYAYSIKSVTSFLNGAYDKTRVNEEIDYFNKNTEEVLKDHIRSNKMILATKNKYSSKILSLTILMCIVLLLLVICLFIF